MAKTYCFIRYKLIRELDELRTFVAEKYKYNRTAPSTIWFDHYSITMAQQRIDEILLQLLEHNRDTPVSKKEVDKEADE